MNRRLVRSILWPLHERLRRRPTTRLLKALRAGERLPPEAIEQMQAVALREVLTHAVCAVPYYRWRFEQHSLNPDQVRSLADLPRVPFLTKDLVRTHGDDLIDPVLRRRLTPHTTSGSTGAPLAFHIDRLRTAADNAARARYRAWWGVWPGDREALVWGSRGDLDRQGPVHRFRDRLFNTLVLPAADLGEAALDEMAAALCRFRPQIVFGYAAALGRLAARLLDGAGGDKPPRPKVVVATAEVFLPTDRRTVTAAFGCGAAAEYGSRECGVVAGECPNGGLHVAAENALVEIVEPDGDALVPAGEAGEIVITLLRPYGMPMIRYRTGDVGRLAAAPCGCGIGLPLLADVEGRRRDLIRLPGGRVVHPSVFSKAMAEAECVARYRVVQTGPAEIDIEVCGAAEGLDAPLGRSAPNWATA